MKSVSVSIGGKALRMGATPLIRLAEIQDDLQKIGQFSPEAIKALAHGVAHSLRRNHPEISVSWVEENLDRHNVQELVSAFAEVNNLVAKGEPGEAVGQSISTT